MKKITVKAENLSVQFQLVHDRSFSFKETMINRFKHLFSPKKQKENFWALQNIDFEVYQGEAFGIIGENGAGKSVMLQMLAGILKPTTGTLTRKGKIATLIELGAGFQPELTGAENLFLNASILGLSRKETEERFDKIVAFAELEDFIDVPIKHYSAGMYLRLGFSVAIEIEPDILLIDEILAVGDEHFQKKCLQRIREFKDQGKTIILVSHSLEMIEEFCQRALCLHNGQILSLGNPSDVVRAYKNRYCELTLDAPDESKEKIKYPAHQLGCGTEANKPVVPIGELMNKQISQTFSIENCNLCEIGVIFATYQRKNNCNIFFKLEEIYPKYEVIHTDSVNAFDFRDNQWFYFSFPSIKDSAHKRYRFTIWSDTEDISNTVTLWHNNQENYSEETFSINEHPETGFVCFRANYVKSIYR